MNELAETCKEASLQHSTAVGGVCADSEREYFHRDTTWECKVPKPVLHRMLRNWLDGTSPARLLRPQDLVTGCVLRIQSVATCLPSQPCITQAVCTIYNSQFTQEPFPCAERIRKKSQELKRYSNLR